MDHQRKWKVIVFLFVENIVMSTINVFSLKNLSNKIFNLILSSSLSHISLFSFAIPAESTTRQEDKWTQKFRSKRSDKIFVDRVETSFSFGIDYVEWHVRRRRIRKRRTNQLRHTSLSVSRTLRATHVCHTSISSGSQQFKLSFKSHFVHEIS